jgi:hypothetical protein
MLLEFLQTTGHSLVNLNLFIVKSYKTTAFEELMEKVQEKIRQERDIRENRKKSFLRKNIPKTREERNEKILIDIVEKMEDLTDIVRQQDKTIRELKVDLTQKIEQLKCYQQKETSNLSPLADITPKDLDWGVKSNNNFYDDISIEEVTKKLNLNK